LEQALLCLHAPQVLRELVQGPCPALGRIACLSLHLHSRPHPLPLRRAPGPACYILDRARRPGSAGASCSVRRGSPPFLQAITGLVSLARSGRRDEPAAPAARGSDTEWRNERPAPPRCCPTRLWPRRRTAGPQHPEAPRTDNDRAQPSSSPFARIPN